MDKKAKRTPTGKSKRHHCAIQELGRQKLPMSKFEREIANRT